MKSLFKILESISFTSPTPLCSDLSCGLFCLYVFFFFFFSLCLLSVHLQLSGLPELTEAIKKHSGWEFWWRWPLSVWMFPEKAMWEALSIKCRHVFMSDIGGVRAALNVQLTLKCAYDIMPSTKRQSTKAPKLLWELQLEKKHKKKQTL